MSRRADPGEVARAAARIDRAATEMDQARHALLAAVRRPSWEGTAAESFRGNMNKVAGDVADAVKGLRKMADDLRIGAAHLRGERVGQELVVRREAQPEHVTAEWVIQRDPVPTLGEAVLHPRSSP